MGRTQGDLTRKGLDMQLRKPRVAERDEVSISRKGDIAVIVYRDDATAAVNLNIGPKLKGMWDPEVLEVHNGIIRSRDDMEAHYEHVAVEISQEHRQIEHSMERNQWVPMGDILRCEGSVGGAGEVTGVIDNRDLSLREFGQLLATRTDWVMRLTSVPDDVVALREEWVPR